MSAVENEADGWVCVWISPERWGRIWEDRRQAAISEVRSGSGEGSVGERRSARRAASSRSF